MQQNRFKKVNIMKVTRNRFKQNCNKEDIEYSNYRFVFADSINLPVLFFTNFFTSNCCKEYFTLKEIVENMQKDLNDILLKFEGTEIIVDNKKTLRLVEIIKNSVPTKELTEVDIISQVIKLRYNKEKNIQFFIYNNNGTLEIYLIDLYHLAIPAEHPVTHKEDPKGIYCAKQKAKIPLSILIHR